MKQILDGSSLVTKISELEKQMGEFYDIVAKSEQAGIEELLTFMAKQKDKDFRRLNTLVIPLLDTVEPRPEYEELYSLYVLPYLDTPVIEKFAEVRDGVDLIENGSILRFALEFEKESLLVYQGMVEALPEEAAMIIKYIVEDKRGNILQLQDTKKELLAGVDDLLVVALNRELLARRFYREAAQSAQSQTGKKFFNEFADFELAHYNKIKEIITARNQGVKLDLPEPEADIKGIDPEVDGEFEPNKDEIVDVIIMAIQAEKDAQARYNKIADMLDDPEGEELFSRFANDERVHQRILEDQLYQMSNKGMIIWE